MKIILSNKYNFYHTALPLLCAKDIQKWNKYEYIGFFGFEMLFTQEL